MKGDFTRSTFRPKKHYRSVRMQQGRVQLDSDWNEQADINNYHIETDVNDMIGRCGAPFYKKDEFKNFKIEPEGKDFKIAPGHIYVNGILCENDAPEDKPIKGTGQPDLPSLPPAVNLAADMPFIPFRSPPAALPEGKYLAFLDIWRRHITSLDDGSIREVALGGPDTATRAKTIWQVKLLRIGNKDSNVNCLLEYTEFKNLVDGPIGKFSAKTTAPGTLSDPCILPLGGGYRRLKNQLYRVEIHNGGNRDKATFKWSRDNGTVVVKWDGISDNKKLKVKDPGRSIMSCFAAGKWVELTDDIRELWGLPGTLVKLTDVNGEDLTFDSDSTIGTIFNSNPDWNPKVRLWDSEGETKVYISGEEWIQLGDDGIQVKFEGMDGTYRTGDYWLIPARTENADVEWPRVSGQPEPQEPHGIKHHYCRLALLEADVNGDLKLLKDCRKLFPSLTELTSLFYVGGDGQEAMPGYSLPEPLKVGVSNGQWPVEGSNGLRPVEGALVKFEIETEGGGTLTAANPVSIDPFIVETDPNGVAQCEWTLGPFPDGTFPVPGKPDNQPPKQRVKATLVDANHNEEFRLPVFFNANLSIAGQVAYFPQGCDSMTTTTTVQNALDRLSRLASLFYVGGDGQEAMPGDPLPQKLQVIVSNECGPVKDVIVTFVAEGGGKVSNEKIKLEDAATTSIFPATSGLDGIAGCFWKPDKNGGSSQILTATLTDAGSNNPIHAPATIIFTANLSIASDVAYIPSLECPALKEVKTVQGAIDTLCHQRGKLECCIFVDPKENLESVLGKIKDGDVICLLAGDHYIESITIKNIKNITIRGCCGESGLYISDKITLQSCNKITIEKLFISGSLILEDVTGFSLIDNILSHPADEKKLELKNCSDVLIESNHIQIRGEGLIFPDSNDIRIRNNSIKSLFTEVFDISIGGNKIELSDNTILSGGAGGIRIFDGSSGLLIRGNILKGGNAGITLGSIIDGNGINDITVSGNTISGVAHYGIANLYGIYGILDIGNKSPLTSVLVENNIISDFSFDPVYLPDENSSLFRINDIIYWKDLLNLIYPGESEEKNPGRRIWDKLDQKTRDLITQWKSTKDLVSDDLKSSVIDSFNTISGLKDFYSAQYFRGVELNDEGLELLKRGDLSKPDLKRLNRLLIETTMTYFKNYSLIMKRFKQYGTIMLPGSNSLKIHGNAINIDLSKLKEKIIFIHLEARESKGVEITGNSVETVGTMMDKNSVGIMFYPSQMEESGGLDVLPRSLSISKNRIEANMAGIIFSVEPLRIHRNLFISTKNNRKDFLSMYFGPVSSSWNFMSLWINSPDVIFTENTCRTRTIYTPPRIQRVIDEKTIVGNEALKTGLKWDARSFQSLSYDLDNGLSGETLRIPQTNLGNEVLQGKTRIIKGKNDPGGSCLIYRTEREIIEFKVHRYAGKDVENALDETGAKVPAGTQGTCYGKLGWMGEDFVGLDGDVSSLARLIIDQGITERKILTVGDTWDIGDGWTLTALAIDANSNPRKAVFVLGKDGSKKDERIINVGDVYTYIEKSIEGKSDVPMFVTYLDSVFSGAASDMVQLKYTWAISTDIIKVTVGDSFGVFEAVDVDKKVLKLENDLPIELAEGSTIPLAGDLVFKVASDFDVLRFMPDRCYTRPGTYAVRGYALDEKTDPSELAVGFTWDFQSFQGFWYDLDSNLTSETLKIAEEDLGDESTPGRSRNISGTTSGKSSGLIYETTRQLAKFKVPGGVENTLDADGVKVPIGTHGTYYGKLGWMTEEFVAINGKANKISRLLIEDGKLDVKTLAVGETWDIGDGWTLTAQSIDTKAHQVWFSLGYNGDTLEEKVVSEGEVYTYVMKNIAGENDVPMFVTNVLDAGIQGLVKLNYTWAISRYVREIKIGDTFGVFEVNEANDQRVRLGNKIDINLASGSTVMLTENLKLEVAYDAGSLRFCPLVERWTYPMISDQMLVRRLPETASTFTGASDTGVVAAIEPAQVRMMVILIAGQETIFSNNICTLDLPYNVQRDNRQGIAHVFLESSANVMGNKCSEVIKESPVNDEDYIFSILAISPELFNFKYASLETTRWMDTSGKQDIFMMPDFLRGSRLPAKLEYAAKTEFIRMAAILLGNITTNRIYPLPDPQNLNLRGR